ncbi:hypothetical protein ACVDG3_16525 [Meridianimarinicoccus sp. RP-17]|uniref:hypothetical protein n=1 Tax=Meridianimarinicoccus zhengii TaxID=2056810 RepID=UPI000DADFE5A|nr:hypothetical protein [Phycocomes zhengii]
MRRILFRVVILLLIAAPVLFAAAALERAPVLPATATLDPRMAAQAKGLASRARATLAGPAGADGKLRFAATEAELNSALAAVAHVARPLRGQTRIDATGVKVAVSGQVPGLPDLGWINVTAHAAPSASGLDIVALRLGRMDLPPGLAVSAVRRFLDVMSGDSIGSMMLDAIAGLDTAPGRAELILAAGPGGGPSMLERLSGAVRGMVGTGDMEATRRHFAALRAAAAAGTLPAEGSALPWVRFVVAQVAAADHATPQDAATDLRAAFVALGAHCGDLRIVEAITGPISDGGGGSACTGTTLDGRRDLRQHFTLSAALAALGSGGVSFGIGEAKELLDAGRDGGSGYSFDDLAFDRAGIRLFDRAVAVAPEGLAALAGRITDESAIAPPIHGLPSGLTEAQFRAQFGGVDSPAYAAMLGDIDARIDGLAVHRAD